MFHPGLRGAATVAVLVLVAISGVASEGGEVRIHETKEHETNALARAEHWKKGVNYSSNYC